MKINFVKTFSIALGASAMLVVSCGKQDQQQQQAAPELAVMTVGECDATLESVYPATLRGTNDVEIRPQISGFITKVCVQEGQYVNKGQTLFVIDQVQLQAQVDAAKAAVAQSAAAVDVAQANVNTAQTNVNNNKILLDQNIIAATAYQTSVDGLNAAKAQLNQAKAAQNSAKANLVSAQKNLSYSTVTAPNAGYVGNIDNKEGALVSPSSLLTTLSSNGDMEAMFSLNEKEVYALTQNGAVSLQAALASLPEVSLKLATGELYAYKGKIVSVSGVLNTATGSASVKAVFQNPNHTLRTGNTGDILIPSTTQNAIMVPQKATYEVQDMKFVFTVDKENKVHSTPIEISKLDDGQNYIVTGGLTPGDVVVVEGVGVSVQDGMEIKPKK
jgi:membrane fusion protein (multidrug efflux system)